MKDLEKLLQVLMLLNDAKAADGASDGLCDHVGEYVIIRTHSAGNWFGKLDKKSGKEVILSDARRMYRWWCAKSISLSGVALYGIEHSKSKIVAPIESVWLEAIEILRCEPVAIKSLKDADHVEAE